MFRVDELDVLIFDSSALDGVVAHGVGQTQQIRNLAQRHLDLVVAILWPHAQHAQRIYVEKRINDSLDDVVFLGSATWTAYEFDLWPEQHVLRLARRPLNFVLGKDSHGIVRCLRLV